ncbi:MAG: aldo/keto reductase [Phycisphaeraceae bacterium]|nr:aldo/keto reductase [Phycisphaeraceae bacterium]
MPFNPDRYSQMTYRRCGRSGLMLPAMTLGGWHNFTDPQVARDLMVHAFDRGVNHFDLANNYGPPPGSAEENVGKVLADTFKGHRDELIISTKAGYRMWPGPYGEWGSKKYLVASLDQSLKRMRLDYVDIFYSHRFDPDTPLEETLGALDLIVRQGKALYAGISSYRGARTTEAARVMQSLGTPITIHQPNYSMLDRWIEGDLLPHTDRLGIGVIVFSPLAQGMLTDKYLNGIPTDSRAGSATGFLRPHQVTPAIIEKVKKLKVVAEARGQSMAQLALTWILRDKRITSVLFGASRVSQIDDNLKALSASPLTAEELGRIDAILAG